MLKIRLQRIGRKNDPSFRVVVVDSHQGPKSGKYVELLGSYNPKLNTVSIDDERAKYWIGHGAQVSDTVHNILVKEGAISGEKINVLPKKSPVVKEEEAEVKDESKNEPKEESKEGESEESALEEAVEEKPAEEKEEEEKKE